MTQYRKSKALQTHKRQVQEAFNFAVFVCHAAPEFAEVLDKVDGGGAAKLPTPVYFQPNKNDSAFFRKELASFEYRLSSYLFLSLFSFFEAFVRSIVQELIDFHGGPDNLIRLANARDARRIAEFSGKNSVAYKMKLRKRVKGKDAKYKKYTEILHADGFPFPTERLAGYGTQMLIERHKKLSASQIPAFLVEGFHMPLDPGDVSKYQIYRDRRNDLAHGKPVKVNLKGISRMNEFFRQWTFTINSHLMEHFFVLEEFAT